MAPLLPVADARAAVLAEIGSPPAAERVPVADAYARVLAVDVVSGEDVPGWDNSAMDGYAVRAADTAGASADSPATLRLTGESRAGEPAAGTLGAGEAFRISTGGLVPDGADSVVRVEDTDHYEDGRAGTEASNEVAIHVEVEPGRDIRRAGDDIRSGDPVLGASSILGSAELGVLASIGIAEPECARRPTLAVVCTGDELLGPSEPMRPGGVRNSNAYALPALARLAGAEVVSVERCADDPEATRDAMAQATEADVTVVCVDVPGCEGGAVLTTADRGTVIFFSMATSFSAAALGAEGLAADITMLVGNGYVSGHAVYAVELLRTTEGVRTLFEGRLAHG